MEKYKQKESKSGSSKKEEGIKWFQEIRIAFMTSILFLLFTTCILWIAHCVSPGEYSGDKLRQYFTNELADALDISVQTADITVEQQLQADASGALKSDTVLLCGTYCPGEDQLATGRFISVWERGELSFWNELFSTKAPYNIALLQVSDDNHIFSTLNCKSCSFEDLNCDGSDKIHIQYLTNFADRTSEADVFLFHSNTGWDIVAPDFSGVESEIAGQISKNGFAMLDTFAFHEPDKPEVETIIYSLAMYGAICQVENPIWGGYDYLYCIAVNDDTAIMSTDHCALVMMRFSDEYDLVRDPNWNSGNVYVDSCENLDINRVVDARWGVQVDGTVFYGMDVE